VDIGAGIIVSRRADLLAGRMIVSVLGMIKGQFHEFRKRNPAPAMNPVQDDFDQFLIFRVCHVWYYNVIWIFRGEEMPA
jgi:hypothetical protein